MMYHSVIAQPDRPILPVPAPSFRHAALTAGFDDFTQTEDDLDTVMEMICQVAAWGVEAKFVGVLQYRLNEQAFVLQAGVGWPVRLIGRCRVSADLYTTAGVAWLTGDSFTSKTWTRRAASGFLTRWLVKTYVRLPAFRSWARAKASESWRSAAWTQAALLA